MDNFDLIVIGAGSGGLAAAKQAASHGARVAIIESSRVGGTCVIRGCVPKKIMYYAAMAGRLQRLAADFGWPEVDGPIDWERLAQGRNDLVDRLERAHEGHLERAGVTLLRGHGRILSPHTVDLDGQQLQATHILIATGASPVFPDFPGVEHGVISDGLFELGGLPSSAAIIGGGYIAVEFAGILQALGCKTSLLVRGELLRGFDHDITAGLAQALRAQGVDLHLGAEISAMTRVGDHVHFDLKEADGSHQLDADACLLFAIGRRPNTRGLGLEDLGVPLNEDGSIPVDEHHQTLIPSIHAIGDVLNRSNLTPVAIKAGRILADRLFAQRTGVTMDYDTIPTAVFSLPPIGTVGMTEAQARAAHGDDIDIYRARFSPLSYSLSPPERKVPSVMKLVVHRSTDRVLGVHMLGDDAAEIIQGFAVAVRMGATKADFDRTVAIHPSQAEEFVLMRTPV